MSSPTKENHILLRLVKLLYSTIIFLFTLGIIYKSVEYLSPDFNSGFLQDKQSIFNYYKVGLYLHIFSSPIVVLLGLFQLLFINNKYHSTIGRFYVFSILLLAAPSGFFMAFYAIGGSKGTLIFVSLSILWFYYTFMGFKSIHKGNIDLHKHYIVGSFILTCSAILLRLFSFINNQFSFIEGINGYLFVALLSWLPWIIIHELRYQLKKLRSVNS